MNKVRYVQIHARTYDTQLKRQALGMFLKIRLIRHTCTYYSILHLSKWSLRPIKLPDQPAKPFTK